MKLLIVTAVGQHQEDILRLFRESNIESFSGSDIDGYKNANSFKMRSSWFPSERGGADSSMFFSFTQEERIDAFFNVVKEFNKDMETDNPIRAVVVPIERFV